MDRALRRDRYDPGRPISDLAALVAEDLAERGPRRPHGDSDALQDLYENLLDAALTVKQAIVERDAPVPGQVIAELRGEIQRRDDLIAEFRRQREPLIRSQDRLVAERNALRRELDAARREATDRPTRH